MEVARAGFTLSRALFGKMWGPSTEATDPIFLEKKTGDLFLLITLVLLGGRPFFRHAKMCSSFCGAPFCGAPVRPNMLNMPKSAAVVGVVTD